VEDCSSKSQNGDQLSMHVSRPEPRERACVCVRV
jgi:hypothetical protein